MSKWATISLNDVCTPASSNLAQKNLVGLDGEYPIFGASGFIKNVDFYKYDVPYIAIVKDGAGVGRTMLLPAYSSVIGTMQYILPKANIDIGYLYYSIENIDLTRYKTGATIPHIYFKDYKTEEIPFPPLDIQKRITTTLDKIQAVIAARREQIAVLDKLAQDTFVDMFGDTVLNPKEWISCKLEKYLTFLTSGSRGWAKYYSEKGEFFITVKNVKSGRILRDNVQHVNAPQNKEAQRTKVQEKDLLISITADLGRTAVIDAKTAAEGAYINQHLSLMRLKLDEVVPEFLSAYFESPAGKRQFAEKDQVGVKSGLNFDALRSMQILLPPYEMQQDYANRVCNIELQKLRLTGSLTELETVYQSTLQKAFNGELFQ
jgi:Restriction endonuclease S subunits